uniref:Short-chain dehydrogenase/reductase family protein n=1 Tax=Mycena chlorophos TaxID=658473 RepID=A0ABQ0LBC8_MYCCL|nr:short-chain dehydrogenase/reductase family protein [Mycena chlorophos]
MSSSAFPTFSAQTTAEEVADTFRELIRGKNVLITGTSMNGIGYEAARVIAKYANLVIITGHNEERLKLSEAAIKSSFLRNTASGAQIRRLLLDLSSQDHVRAAAAEVLAYPEPLHALIHNAGAPISLTPTFIHAPGTTLDGVDVQWATNHFGPFLFTKLLLPKLYQAAREDADAGYVPRVVYISANGHQFGKGVDLEQFGQAYFDEKGSSGAMQTYWATKSANIMVAAELARRSKERVRAYSLHPGVVYTNIFERMKETNSFPAEIRGAVGGNGKGIVNGAGNPTSDIVSWKTIPQGAATTVAAAFDPRLDGFSGAYLVDCCPATDQVAPHTADEDKAARLWALTEEMIGETLDF